MLGICGGSPSPQPSPREERGEGEVIDRPSCLNLNSSRFSCCQDVCLRAGTISRGVWVPAFAGTTKAIGCLKIEDGLLGKLSPPPCRSGFRHAVRRSA